MIKKVFITVFLINVIFICALAALNNYTILQKSKEIEKKPVDSPPTVPPASKPVTTPLVKPISIIPLTKPFIEQNEPIKAGGTDSKERPKTDFSIRKI